MGHSFVGHGIAQSPSSSTTSTATTVENVPRRSSSDNSGSGNDNNSPRLADDAFLSLYPRALSPDHEEVIPGLEVSVPAANIVFKRWRGKPIKDDFGGRPVAEYEGRPLFAELAVVKMVVKSGWSAFWQEVYPIRKSGPHYYSDWKEDSLRKDQVTANINNASSLDSQYHQNLQATIAKYNGNSYKGCWDIIAWNGERTVLYIESKQFNKDIIRDNQVRWFSACLSAGLKKNKNFLIVQWRFED
jgi:hypothetical protein